MTETLKAFDSVNAENGVAVGVELIEAIMTSTDDPEDTQGHHPRDVAARLQGQITVVLHRGVK